MTSLLPLLVFAAASGATADTLPGVGHLSDARQHVVVVVERADATTGRLYRMEPTPEGWRPAGAAAPVVVGRSGVGSKREGDGRSPAGVFPLGGAFGYAADPPPGLRLDYRPLGPRTVCVDDPRSPHYNRIVEEGPSGDRGWTSAERMRRDLAHGDDLYEWGVLVGYNADREPGAGSCIFLHVWRGASSPTVGCTALPRERLLELMGWLHPDRRPVLVQATRAELERSHREGRLPYPPPGRE